MQSNGETNPPVSPSEPEEPVPDASVPAGRRLPRWANVPRADWEDWQWQMRNAVRTTRQLADFFAYSPEELEILRSLEKDYKLTIPPYYLSLIDPEDPEDPIRLQSVPTTMEATTSLGLEFDDPLEEDQDSPVPGLTHRYPDRVLMITTPVCTMYCRYCTRKRVTLDKSGWDAPSRNDQRMIDYIRDHSEIHDVIVSGGDPLSLPLTKLEWLITELSAIPHVDVIRIGTRVPVTLPQRLFDPVLIDLLARSGKIWIQTHFNHPREVTPEAARGVRNLINAGMPVNNHSVLLRGVNDSVATMKELCRALLRIKVRPYYIFHCDPVTGASHFRTSIWKGIEIVEGLRGHMSGLGVPTYVVDGLKGAGKIPLTPNYLVSASESSVVLRNYEGLIFRYDPRGGLPAPSGQYEATGVSGLLAGQGQSLVPESNPRMERRRANAKRDASSGSFGASHRGTS